MSTLLIAHQIFFKLWRTFKKNFFLTLHAQILHTGADLCHLINALFRQQKSASGHRRLKTHLSERYIKFEVTVKALEES